MNDTVVNSLNEKQAIIIFDLVIGLISILIILTFYQNEDWGSGKERSFFEREKSYRYRMVRYTATEFFKQYSKPTQEHLKEWGVRDFRVVGYNSLMKKSIAGKMLISEKESSSENYTVNIPFCYQGTNLSGEKVKNIRILEFVISSMDYSIVHHSIKNERKTTVYDSMFFWLKTTFLFPLSIFVILFGFFMVYNYDFREFRAILFCALFCAWRGTRFIGGLNSVYTSYISWGSVVKATFFTILYLFIYFLFIILLNKISDKFDDNSAITY